MDNSGQAGFSWRDLLSADADHAARAANAVLEGGAPAETLLERRRPASALERSIEQGNRTAASVLLLGYCGSAAEPRSTA